MAFSGRAQFVRHVGQEHALEPAGFENLAVFGFQLDGAQPAGLGLLAAADVQNHPDGLPAVRGQACPADIDPNLAAIDALDFQLGPVLGAPLQGPARVRSQVFIRGIVRKQHARGLAVQCTGCKAVDVAEGTVGPADAAVLVTHDGHAQEVGIQHLALLAQQLFVVLAGLVQAADQGSQGPGRHLHSVQHAACQQRCGQKDHGGLHPLQRDVAGPVARSPEGVSGHRAEYRNHRSWPRSPEVKAQKHRREKAHQHETHGRWQHQKPDQKRGQEQAACQAIAHRPCRRERSQAMHGFIIALRRESTAGHTGWQLTSVN